MSLELNPVNWFEIPSTDIGRSKTFYSAVFGNEFFDLEMGPAKLAMFPMEKDRLGSGGALVQAEGYTPSHAGTMVYFPVPDIEATLGKIEAGGGKMLMPKTSIGDHGHIAHFEDIDGNRVGLHTPADG